MLAMIGMAVFASFASFWPYNLTPSLKHYTMGLVDAEVGDAFVNSLKLAAGHRAVRHRDRLRRRLHAREDARRAALRPIVRLLAMLPMAVPGLVLGSATSSSSTCRTTR
jgi:iron(III) transport system permease protein